MRSATQAGGPIIPALDTQLPTPVTPVGPRSREARPTALKLASLALEWMEQARQLNVRQREELRRALAHAASFRGWLGRSDDTVQAALKDVSALARAGSKHMADEVERELAEKKTESRRLEKALAAVVRQVDEGSWDEPVEITVAYSCREGSRYATHEETLTLQNEDEAREAAQLLEKKVVSSEKIRLLMIQELKLRRQRLREMHEAIGDFAEDATKLVREVLAVMY